MYRIDRSLFHITSNVEIRRVSGVMLGRANLVAALSAAHRRARCKPQLCLILQGTGGRWLVRRGLPCRYDVPFAAREGHALSGAKRRGGQHHFTRAMLARPIAIKVPHH